MSTLLNERIEQPEPALTAYDYQYLSDAERRALASLEDATDLEKGEIVTAPDLDDDDVFAASIDPDMPQPKAPEPTAEEIAAQEIAAEEIARQAEAAKVEPEPTPAPQPEPAPVIDYAAQIAEADAKRRALMQAWDDMADPSLTRDDYLAQMDALTVERAQLQLAATQQQERIAAEQAAAQAQAAQASQAWEQACLATVQRYGLDDPQHYVAFDAVLRQVDTLYAGKGYTDQQILDAAVNAYAVTLGRPLAPVAGQAEPNPEVKPGAVEPPKPAAQAKPELPPTLGRIPAEGAMALGGTKVDRVLEVVNASSIHDPASVRAAEKAMEMLSDDEFDAVMKRRALGY